MIKILHAADFHLDSPFDALPTAKAAQRRTEQRDLLENLADTANREGVDLVLLSGDLLDSDKSYFETGDALIRAFGKISVPIFISPGNHDYYHKYSPWRVLKLPANVHVFTSPTPESVVLESLGVTVWGAAFTANRMPGLLSDFPPIAERKQIHVMALHGTIGNSGDSVYNPMTEQQIAATGLNYLALGHEHSFSGLQKAGDTYYAYSGCPEGRGFDETGAKGVILAEVRRYETTARFVNLDGRQYHHITVDLSETGDEDSLAAIVSAITAALPEDTRRDIYRLTLSGAFGGRLDLPALGDLLADRFFHLELRDRTQLRRNIWAGAEEDTLRGLFLRKMRTQYDAAIESGDSDVQDEIVLAVRYALVAMGT